MARLIVTFRMGTHHPDIKVSAYFPDDAISSGMEVAVNDEPPFFVAPFHHHGAGYHTLCTLGDDPDVSELTRIHM